MRIPLPRRLLLLTTMIVWVFGTFYEGWHERTVRHVVCERHGDVIELAPDGGHHESGIYAAAPDGHKGCTLPVPAPAEPVHPPQFLLAEADAPMILEPMVRLPGARAPPLRYAPKTSPPQV